MLILIIMNIRNRITQFLWTLVTNIKCSKGNILLGRVTGAGPAQELTIGSGLQITGTTLSATGGGGGTGTSENEPSTLVMRNPAGGFSAGAIAADGVSVGACAMDGFGLRKGTIWVYFPNAPLAGEHFPVFPSGSGTLALTGNANGTISPSDIPGLSTSGDGTGLHELHLNSAGGVCGLLNLWSDAGFKAQIYAPLSYTANRTIELPDADGTVALLTDVEPATTAPVNAEAGGTKANNTIHFQTSSNISITGGTQSISKNYIYLGNNEWRASSAPSEHRVYFDSGYWYITHRNTLDYALGTGGAPLVFRAAGTINSDPSSLTYSHAPGSDGSGGAWAVTAVSGSFAGVAATAPIPPFRVAGGFLYVQEAGIWKKAALSSL